MKKMFKYMTGVMLWISLIMGCLTIAGLLPVLLFVLIINVLGLEEDVKNLMRFK